MINPLEWIVMELPANPADILYGIFDKRGENVLKQRELDEQEYIRQLFDSSTGHAPRTYNPLATAEQSEEIPFYGYNMGDQLGAYEGGIF